LISVTPTCVAVVMQLLMTTMTRYGVGGLKHLGKNAPPSATVSVRLMSLSIRCVSFSFSPVLVSADGDHQ